jgi:hypothetical protein
VDGATITDGRAQGGNGGVGAVVGNGRTGGNGGNGQGSAIYNTGTLEIADNTFTDGLALGGNGGHHRGAAGLGQDNYFYGSTDAGIYTTGIVDDGGGNTASGNTTENGLPG